MTARDGNYIPCPSPQQLFSDDRMGTTDLMNLITTGTAANVANSIYKNQGYYVAGSVWETWQTSGAPSIIPPTGHTLTNITYVVLQP